MGYVLCAHLRCGRAARTISRSQCVDASGHRREAAEVMRNWRAIFVLVAFIALPSRSSAAPPNIVFLLADDLRWDTLGCAGNKIVQTPNIDALAKRGTMFRNAFVTTSICCVSRASIFSGQYARRHGIEDFKTSFTASAWSN